MLALGRSEGETDPSIEKTIGEMLNNTRNELKHYGGDDSLTFDLRSDCLEMLERAIANYQALTGTLQAEAMHVRGTECNTLQRLKAEAASFTQPHFNLNLTSGWHQ